MGRTVEPVEKTQQKTAPSLIQFVIPEIITDFFMFTASNDQ